MANYTMTAVLLVAFLICYHQQVRCNPIKDIQQELRERVAHIDTAFARHFKELVHNNQLYLARRVQLNFRTYPDILILVELANHEFTRYKRQRRALLVAIDVIQRYFIYKHAEPIEWLPKTRNLVDLIVKRCIQRACELDLEDPEQLDRRRKIHALSRFYPLLQKVADGFLLSSNDRKSIAIKARAWMDEAMQLFRGDIPDSIPDDQVSRILELIDERIILAEIRYDQDVPVNPNAEISRDIDDISREAATQSMALYNSDVLNDAMRRYRTDHVLVFEDTLALNNTQRKMELYGRAMGRLAHDYINERREFFDLAQLAAEENRDYPLMAVSARMALSLCMIYAREDRLLQLLEASMQQYFIEKSRQFNRPLVENSHLFELIHHRSIFHSILTAWIQTKTLRREIYILLNRHRGHERIERLARRFYSTLEDKKRKNARFQHISSELYDRYQDDVSFVLNQTELRELILDVDQFIENVITESDQTLMQTHTSEQIDNFSPRDFVNQLYEQARGRIERAASEGCTCSEAEIDSVEIEVLIQFEERYHQPANQAEASHSRSGNRT